MRRRYRLFIPIVVLLALLCMLSMIAAVAGQHAGNSLVVSTITLDGSPMNVVVDARTDHAFVSSIDYTNADNLTMLDMRTGNRLRSAINAGQGESAMALDERASRLLIAGAPRDGTLGLGAVEVIDTRDGHTITTTLQGNGVGAVAVDGTPWRGTPRGRAFILSGLKVGMLDEGSARGLKTIDVSSSGVGFAGGPVTIDARTGRGFAIVQKDAKAGLSTLLMFDTRRGVLLGEVAAGVNPLAVVTDARAGRAYLSGLRETRVLNIATGTLLPVRLPPGYIAVDERRGHAFLDDFDRIYVLDARSGHIIRTIALAHRSSGSIAVDARTGDVIITDVGPINQSGSAAGAVGAVSFEGNGSVSVIDVNSGAILRTVAVGVFPRSVALDGQGRLIVVNGGGALRVPDAWGWMPAWLRARAPFLPAPRARTRDVPGGITILDLSRL